MAKQFVLEKVRKRDGRLVQYNRAKIESVIEKAAAATETELPAGKLAGTACAC